MKTKDTTNKVRDWQIAKIGMTKEHNPFFADDYAYEFGIPPKGKSIPIEIWEELKWDTTGVNVKEPASIRNSGGKAYLVVKPGL